MPQKLLPGSFNAAVSRGARTRQGVPGRALLLWRAAIDNVIGPVNGLPPTSPATHARGYWEVNIKPHNYIVQAQLRKAGYTLRDRARNGSSQSRIVATFPEVVYE